MSDQNLAARVRAALDAGEGILRLAPDLGAAVIPDAGRPAQARAARPLRPGHPSRRHRRALVRLDHRRGQRRRPARRGAELRRPRRGQVHAQGRHRPARPRDDRRRHVGQISQVAGVQQVLRQPRPDPPPHAPVGRPGQAAGPRGEAGELLFPAAIELDREQFPLYVHGAGARHRQGRHPPLPGAVGRGRQRHPRLFQSLSAQARHRLADPPVRAARAGLPGDV